MSKRLDIVRVTIPDSAAVSNSFRLDQGRIVGVRIPASWAATAVEVRFEESSDSFSLVADASATFRRILDGAGAQMKVTGVASSQSMQIPEASQPANWPRVRIVGTTAVPANVTQTGDKVVEVLVLTDGK